MKGQDKTPFGLGLTKPKHYREMLRIAWENRDNARYAWRVLNEGVCDGCALGTTGLRDWTLEDMHLCAVRLNLLRLNTMGPLEPAELTDVARLAGRDGKQLRALGRLGHPLRRRAGEPGFSRISWDEAIDEIGGKLAATDPRRAALYMTSRGITNEVYFAAQKAWRAYGSNHVDNAARLCHSPSTAAMKQVLGVAASTCSYRDWYGSDLVVFFGSNPANDQPVALKYLYEAKKQGTRVLVVNTYREPGMERYWIPSNTDSALFGTDIADDFFHVSVGGDQAFVMAATKILIGRYGIARDFVDAHAEGLAEFQAKLDAHTIDDLIAMSGASRKDVVRFVDALTQANTGVFVWSMGITQHAHGTETVAAICSLGVLKGFVGRERCGLMPIRGHSGVQGGAEMGAYATVFPGGLPINNQSAAQLGERWGFEPPTWPGLDAAAMIDAAGAGRTRCSLCGGRQFPRHVAPARRGRRCPRQGSVPRAPGHRRDPADAAASVGGGFPASGAHALRALRRRHRDDDRAPCDL